MRVIPDSEARRHLDSGERLVWSGTPKQGRVLRPSPFAFWTAGMAWPGASWYEAPAFEPISAAKRIHDQIVAAQRAAA